MEPVEMFRRTFYVHIYRFESLCGADILRPDFRPHKWTFFWMTVNASFSLCSVYTLFAYEVVVKWKCLSCIGITIQGLVKYAVVLYNATKIRTKVEFLHSIYKANGDSRTNNYRSLKKYGHMSLIVVMVGAAMVCSSCAVFLPFTKLENYVTNKHEPLLQGYLPLVDANTDVGYFVLYVYHLMLLFLAGTGTTAVDVLLTLLVLHLWPMADIIQNMSDVLNERVLERRSCESAEMERFFRNFILVHKEFCNYLKGIAQIYWNIIFCEIYTCGVSLCLLIFCILTLDWKNLYFLLLLMFVKLWVFCCLGTIAEIATDRVNATLLKSNWHRLPLRQQRFMIMMILRSQNPTILMAGTMKLNLDTFVNVMKTVYTVGMMLIETAEG